LSFSAAWVNKLRDASQQPNPDKTSDHHSYPYTRLNCGNNWWHDHAIPATKRVSTSVAGIYAGTHLAFVGATACVVPLRVIVST
jgi:hypothetical protein